EIRASGRRGEVWYTDATTIHYEERPAAGVVVAVNLGASVSYIDDAGVVWEADLSPDGARRTHRRIAMTRDEPLFQTAREGITAYRLDVPDGVYEVEIGLAEVDARVAPGERVVSVLVNGASLFRDVDLVRDYGPYTAVRRKIVVPAAGGNGIEVRFAAAAGSPLAAAVAVRRVPR
ncbi:MAG: malectin domain-containing carbohydrate-binding protein, partial [Thermoanaerobaculia bacterium]